MAGISKYTAQHTLTSDLSMSHVNARWIRLNVLNFYYFIPHIKEMVCCFVLDIIMTFTAAVVTSAFAAPVYMVLLNVL